MGMVWVKDINNGFGSGPRVQRNYYAWLVAQEMTGGNGECPTCDAPLTLAQNAAHVDRVLGGETLPDGSEVYREGSIVYVCAACNLDRGKLQARGEDFPRVADYVADVAAASARVSVPTQAEARRWWASRPTAPVRRLKY